MNSNNIEKADLMRALLLFAIICLPCRSNGVENDLGVAFLEKHCASCHGDDNAYPGLDVRDRVTLFNPEDDSEEPYLVPGDLENSRIWQVVIDGDMPPEDQPRPSEEEVESLKEWILDGAPFSTRTQRPFIGEQTVISNIVDDLQNRIAPADREFTRYFTLHRAWNDGRISDKDLRLIRAAVSKMINSLSSQSRISVPQIVDEEGLLLRIDLRDYGWSNSHHWNTLVKENPFALTRDDDNAEQMELLAGTHLPYIRADWFVREAGSPNLYHELTTLPNLLGIPQNVRTLEDVLNVNSAANIRADRVLRAGFSGRKSGVSGHNRIVERHDSSFGYYWLSYDSASDVDRQNFIRFPLGPVGVLDIGEPFEHDGGEYIFSLPNGLQGYMLSNSTGERINIGPSKIVSDPNRFGGSYDIQNGISCFGCHKHGMIAVEDSIRAEFERDLGKTGQKVRALYAVREAMNKELRRDRERFMAALDEACGSFLQIEEDAEKQLEDFPEPITTVARKYNRDLQLDDVVRELCLPQNEEVIQILNADQLKTLITTSDVFRRLGIAHLAQGEFITREQWERAFKPVARETRVGIPLY